MVASAATSSLLLGSVGLTLSGGFSLVVAVIGWHYLFFSRAAQRLNGVEEEPSNRVRVFLRRCGGACMFALGICVYALFNTLDLNQPGRAALSLLLAILLLLATITLLALIDLRLTWKLRRRH